MRKLVILSMHTVRETGCLHHDAKQPVSYVPPLCQRSTLLPKHTEHHADNVIGGIPDLTQLERHRPGPSATPPKPGRSLSRPLRTNSVRPRPFFSGQIKLDRGARLCWSPMTPSVPHASGWLPTKAKIRANTPFAGRSIPGLGKPLGGKIPAGSPDWAFCCG